MGVLVFKIDGFDNAHDALRKLGSDIDTALPVAVEAGVLLIENEAKVLAPKLSGTLARSITHERVT